MPITRISIQDPVNSSARISTSNIVNAAESAAAIGKDQMRQNAQMIDQMTKVIKAAMPDSTSDAQASINKAKFEAQKLIMERYQNKLDDRGLPTYGSLTDDVNDILTNIGGQYSSGLSGKALQSYNNKWTAFSQQQQLGALRQFNSQVGEHKQVTFNETVQGLVNDSLSGSTAPGNAFAELDQMVAPAVNSGMDHSSVVNSTNNAKRQIEQGLIDKALDSGDIEGAMELNGQAKFIHEKSRQNNSLRIHNAQVTIENAQLKEMSTLEKSAIDVLKEGGMVDEAIYDEINTLGAKYGKDSLAEEMTARLRMLEDFNNMPEEAQRQLIDQLRSSASNSEGFKLLQSIYKETNSQRDNDPVRRATVQKHIPHLDDLDPSSEDFIGLMTAKSQTVDAVTQATGKINTGLTAADVDNLVKYLNSPDRTTNDLLRVYASINSVYGENALRVYEQIGDKKDTFHAFVGNMILLGNVEGAESVLNGKRLLQNKKFEVPRPSVFQAEVLEELIPTLSPAAKSDQINAIMASYADIAMKEGHYDTKDIKQSILDKAMANVLAGQDEIEMAVDIKIELPSKEFESGEDFLDWVGGISEEELMELGAPESLYAQLQDFDNTFLVSTSPGNYAILVRDSGGNIRPQDVGAGIQAGLNVGNFRYVTDSRGRPYELDYHKVQALRAGEALEETGETQETADYDEDATVSSFLEKHNPVSIPKSKEPQELKPLLEQEKPMSNMNVEQATKMASAAGISSVATTQAYQKLQEGINSGKVKKSDRIMIVDFSKPYGSGRLIVQDTRTGKILFQSTATMGVRDEFSNQPGSNLSSKGFMVTGGAHRGRRVKDGVKLHGQEKGVNDNVFKRGIVIHGTNSRRSHGCIAVPHNLYPTLKRMVLGGIGVFVNG